MINLNIRFLSIPLLSLTTILLLTACPDNTPLNCGDNQIEVNGACECEDGYHWNEDQTRCLMDTTSHNFTWEIDTIGEYGSQLKDAWIVDENNIWVVGSLSISDSTLNYPGEKNYNAAHWNGSEWEYLKIYDSHLDLYSIVYFAEDDIWVTSFGFPIHWDGTEWTLYHLQNMGLNVSAGFASWGTSSSNMYFVGYQGSIVHYDGGSAGGGQGFTKMESGTDVDLKDIAGTPDGEHVFAVGWDDTYPGRSIILEYFGGQWTTLYYCEGVLPSEECQGAINTCTDVIGDTAYFILGYVGLWKYNYLTGESEIIPENEIYFSNRGFPGFKGQGENDISFIANWGELIHYNGSNWHLDTTVLDQFGPYNIQVKGMDFKGNTIVSVGYAWNPVGAFMARGYRQ